MSKVAHFGGMYTYDAIAAGDNPQWAGPAAYCRDRGMVWAPSIGPGYIDDRAVPGNTTPTLERADGAGAELPDLRRGVRADGPRGRDGLSRPHRVLGGPLRVRRPPPLRPPGGRAGRTGREGTSAPAGRGTGRVCGTPGSSA
ncbi:hypothetical protein [Streptomyces sp. NEAU-174]|uniref:hypothetical protein n=1 Tax=Streptomyces sp. NEAU-174 TaxID=3458254 RepID=UPI0040450CE9